MRSRGIRVSRILHFSIKIIREMGIMDDFWHFYILNDLFNKIRVQRLSVFHFNAFFSF